MHLGNRRFQAEFNEAGSCVSCRVADREMLATAASARPLFAIGLLDQNGRQKTITALDGTKPVIETAIANKLTFTYGQMGGLDLQCKIHVVFNDETDSLDFQMSLVNNSEERIEWFDFQAVVIPDNLGFREKDAKIFWPGNEGCLVGDVTMREKTGAPYKPVGYPAGGWGGYYPGPAQMQFMAYLTEKAGLYFASHDPSYCTKEIEYCLHKDGVQLINKVFLGAWGKGEHVLPYSIVMAACGSSWMDAAEIYRQWIQSGAVKLLPPLQANAAVPEWIKDSPIVVTYPVRGNGHHGFKTYPNDYFPYTRALPHLDKLAETWNAPLLTLLMHWEGTAPWAPPYVWPPLGGEEKLQEFTDALHQRGHRIGLYCSGTAWTNSTGTGDGTYNRQAQFDQENLAHEMCLGPKGELGCLICNGDELRYGYDMCTHSNFARKAVAEEAGKMAAAGVDYIQIFDQNLGGASYPCWSKEHGHEPAPGPWQQQSIRDLVKEIKSAISTTGNHAVIGCEAAAAEAYLEEFPFNDLRQMINWMFFGIPVPAFAYVYHEYVCNFSGNQCGITTVSDPRTDPYNHYLRSAYSFIAGDLLTVVLKNGGELYWGWCSRWDEFEPPQQAPYIDFVGTLNNWRRGAARDFLLYGRMEKPVSISGPRPIFIHRLKEGIDLPHPSVLSSAWSTADGRRVQILCNYLPEPQTITVNFPQGTRCQLTTSPWGNPFHARKIDANGLTVTLAPLAVAMIEILPDRSGEERKLSLLGQ